MSNINVLWLDDESDEMLEDEDWRAQFEDENITLHAEKYADQAILRIKENPGEWDIIVLDAIGYRKEGAALNGAGLSYAILEIRKVEMTHNIQLPIFIYTGQDSLFEDDEFIDSYPDIPIYRKGWKGTESLINDIKKQVSSRVDRAIKVMYPQVFDSIKYLGLKESEQKLLGFLKAVHYKEYRLQRTPITDLRIILEELFHALIKPENGLIPQECYKSDKRELNMADVILYMSGEQTKSEFGKAPAYGGVGVVDLEGPIYPALMSSFINTLYVYVSATDSHVKRIIDDEKTEFKNQCMQYSAKVEGSYIGFSFAYQICDILTYTAAYVKNHPDPVMNRCRVYQLRDDHNSGCKIETTDGIMHFGKHCWADSSEFNEGESLNLKKIKLETTPKGVFKYKISKKK